MNKKDRLFAIFAVFSLLAAIYHLSGIFYRINESPVWRHALFVTLNLICVFGFLKRPKYFVHFYFVLLLQQYYSHGRHLLELWNLQHKIHWPSFMMLVLLPIGLFYLVKECKAKRIRNLSN